MDRLLNCDQLVDGSVTERYSIDRWRCPVRNCEVTRDKNLYEEADMIVFNFLEQDFTAAGENMLTAIA